MFSELTPNIRLPFILPAQAQKHVTHNEALRALDALVQLSVTSRAVTAPPGSPADGDRYLVPSGATGAWAGATNEIAAYQDGAWLMYQANTGWLVWVEAEAALLVWNGTAWVAAAVSSLNPASMVGVNATADTTNRLSVASTATLLNHAGAGHQVKVNKNAAGDTASLLYQTGFSGRAELGLAGNDNFSVKVSPDGSAWHVGFEVAASSGHVSMPAGLDVSANSASAALTVTQAGAGNVLVLNDATGDTTPLVVTGNGSVVIGNSATVATVIGTAARTPIAQVLGTGDSTSAFLNARFGADNGGPTSYFAKSRNTTVGSHTVVANGDALGIMTFAGSDGDQMVEAARITVSVDGAPGNDDMPGRIAFLTTPDGSNSSSERMRIDNAGRVGIGTTAPSTTLHVSGPVRCGSYTVATVPSAATAGAGSMIYVSNETGGAVLAFSDGTNWLRVTDRAVIA